MCQDLQRRRRSIRVVVVAAAALGMSLEDAEKEEEGEEEEVIHDSLKIDFTDPAFMTRNIKYKQNFEEFNIINEECRIRMIHTSCDQTCFYVLCALKAYELIGEIPTIVIYGGGGVMGSCIVDALVECGCKPFLKIFARDSVAVQKWLKLGIRSTVKFDENSSMSILIIASNLASWSQLCRDVGCCLKSTTFVISTVFGLQRKRVFHLYRSPGVVRTFVERKMSKRKTFTSAKLLLYRKDSMKNLFLIVENYMVMLGIEPSVARDLLFDIFLGHNNVQQHSPQRLLDITTVSNPFSSLDMSAKDEVNQNKRGGRDDGDISSLSLPAMSPAHASSDIFTPIKPTSRRASREDFAPPCPFSPQALSAPLFPKIASHSNKNSAVDTDTSMHDYLLGAITALETAYGVLFAEELSKHVDEMKLPSMHAIHSSKVFSPMPKKCTPKKGRRISMRDRGHNQKADHTKYSGYLDEDALMRIFNSDKKTAPDVKTSSYLEYINSLSADEDEDEEIDFGLESFSDDIFDTPSPAPPEEDKYIVMSSVARSLSGAPIISRLASDICVGKHEGKRFNVPSTLKKIES